MDCGKRNGTQRRRSAKFIFLRGQSTRRVAFGSVSLAFSLNHSSASLCLCVPFFSQTNFVLLYAATNVGTYRIREARIRNKAGRLPPLRKTAAPTIHDRNCLLSIACSFKVEPSGTALYSAKVGFTIQRITLAGLLVYQVPASPCVALRVEAQGDVAFFFQVETHGDATRLVHALDGEGFPAGYGIDRYARTFLAAYQQGGVFAGIVVIACSR